MQNWQLLHRKAKQLKKLLSSDLSPSSCPSASQQVPPLFLPGFLHALERSCPPNCRPNQRPSLLLCLSSLTWQEHVCKVQAKKTDVSTPSPALLSAIRLGGMNYRQRATPSSLQAPLNTHPRDIPRLLLR